MDVNRARIVHTNATCQRLGSSEFTRMRVNHSRTVQFSFALRIALSFWPPAVLSTGLVEVISSRLVPAPRFPERRLI